MNRLDMSDTFVFYIRNDDNRYYAIHLEPNRYVEQYENGNKYYFDKLTNSKIPEEVFKLILEELITQPIKKSNVTLNELYATLLQTRERVRRTLYKGFELDAAIMPSEDFLQKYLNRSINMLILYVDIVGSTKLSQQLTADKLAQMIKIFAQEMSCLIAAYNGYILKYAGDSVIAFFPILNNDTSIICKNAVNCARSMINIVRYAINPVLINNSYPAFKIKIGIDVGENKIISIGKNLDIIGYTMSITSKIAELGKAWNIIIGKWVYDELDDDMKELFKEVKISKNRWDYKDSKKGEYYSLYTLKKKIMIKRKANKKSIYCLH